jgi:hypothetical protein
MVSASGFRLDGLYDHLADIYLDATNTHIFTCTDSSVRSSDVAKLKASIVNGEGAVRYRWPWARNIKQASPQTLFARERRAEAVVQLLW